MPKNNKSAAAGEPSTEELLDALNKANTPAHGVADAPSPDFITLAAGPTKLAIFLHAQITMSRERSDGKVLPPWIVYVVKDGKVDSTHYSYSLGQMETFVNLTGKKPDVLPWYLPGGSAYAQNSHLPERIDWWLQTDAELKVYTHVRGVSPPESGKKADAVAPNALPAVNIPNYSTPGLSDAMRLMVRIVNGCSPALIKSGHASSAAELLSMLALSLSGIEAGGVPAQGAQNPIALLPMSAVFSTPGLGAAVTLVLEKVHSHHTLHQARTAAHALTELLTILRHIDADRREQAQRKLSEEQHAADQRRLNDLMA